MTLFAQRSEGDGKASYKVKLVQSWSQTTNEAIVIFCQPSELESHKAWKQLISVRQGECLGAA